MTATVDVREAIRSAIGRHGYPDDATVTAFSVTENPTFRIDADGHPPVVLRIYHPGGRPRREIESELAWMDALRRGSPVAVPRVLPAADGSVVLDVGTAAAPVFAAVFELVAGREMTDDDLPLMIRRLGETAAHLHAHARRWERPAWFDRPVWNVVTTLGDVPHWGPWHASVRDPGQRAQLQRLADVVERRLRAFGDDANRFGLVHADLRMANVLYDGDDVTIIDFDDSGSCWYLYDLASTFTFCEGRPDVDELTEEWVAAYRTVGSLPARDVAEIPTFLMLRRLLVCAFAGHRADTDLVAEMHATGYFTESCELAERYLSAFA